MEIVYLQDHKEYLPIVVEWIYEEFIIPMNAAITKEDIFRHFEQGSYENFPITFIAVESGRCIGTVSIFKNDLKARMDLKPWMAALYVDINHRVKGVAEKLMYEAIDKTKAMGYCKLYLRTEHTADYYQKRNWSKVCRAVDQYGQETEVYSYNIVKSICM